MIEISNSFGEYFIVRVIEDRCPLGGVKGCAPLAGPGHGDAAFLGDFEANGAALGRGLEGFDLSLLGLDEAHEFFDGGLGRGQDAAGAEGLSHGESLSGGWCRRRCAVR